LSIIKYNFFILKKKEENVILFKKKIFTIQNKIVFFIKL